MTQKYPRFVSPYKYAQLCGVSDAAIYQRIERGVLEVIEETTLSGDVKRFIDTEKFPPSRLIDYPIEYKGKKKKKEE